MDHDRWEFWIDVGGTFTDCIGRRSDGILTRHKLLSSGVTKGAAAAGSTVEKIVDPLRRHDPPRFWIGCRLRILDQAGHTICETTVAEFDQAAGELRLAESLPAAPQVGQAYELLSDQEAPVLAVRYLLGLAADEPIPAVTMRLGTTRGTNALITRRGARTALVTTRGFGDILHIGYQNRPRLFDLSIHKPEPLFSAVVEIDERIAADGTVLQSPDLGTVRHQLAALLPQGIQSLSENRPRRRGQAHFAHRASQNEPVPDGSRIGFQSLAICLLHSSDHPRHEQLVAAVARELGFDEISISSQVAPLVKIVSRGDTTVMDAYLNPIIRAYIARLREALAESDLRIVTSAGGLVAADQFVGKDSILSGPAGGVVGFSKIAAAAGFQRAIGFDMGGTSTDVSRFDGRYELEYETEKSGVRVVAPMMAIETVAAGGGSICGFDGVKLTVGPDSAGADPGPACYGRGGPLAVTDLNFYLGKILPEYFPFPLDRQAVEERLAALALMVAQGTGVHYVPIELADGFLRVANASMGRALRRISIARGCDPADYILVPFGGAAGQHACALAEELGIRQLLCHPDAGLLSAVGIGLADPVRHKLAGVYQPYSTVSVAALEPLFERLITGAREELLAEAGTTSGALIEERIKIHRRLDLRYRGVEAALTITQPADGDYPAAFAIEHEKLYGYTHPNRPLEIVALRIEAVGRWSEPLPASRRMPVRQVTATRHTTTFFAAQPHRTGLFDRRELCPGDTFYGPAIIREMASTTVIDPGWQAEVLSEGELLLAHTVQTEGSGFRVQDEDTTTTSSSCSSSLNPDPRPLNPLSEPRTLNPISLEIFNNQFAGIAEQMGLTLRNTAGSVNVKERLDFSCAIFTAAGELVVNAPHIPVHLGAMGQSVRRILADNPALEPGDVFVTNDPYRGGSHLPDITVVTPVHETQDEARSAGRTPRLLFFTASRAHHAEIGGIVPGSMPPFSRNLAEEGVLIRNFKLVSASRSRMEEFCELLLSDAHPTRAISDNRADVAAQVAANRQGAMQLDTLIHRETWPVVEAYMRHIQAAAERKLRLALAKLPPGRREFVDHLDDGSPIRVAVTRAAECDGGEAICIDFTGTGPVLPGNLNANRAIVTSAVMYVLRLLIDEDIPLNEGVLAPVRLVLPECLLNPPERETAAECAAVVGGNVETSQRVVDVLLGALRLAAASQGTMNNLLFGDATFGYYETICGGAGATPFANGADAVHTHMTNTRLTDPEILERRYPVRLWEFSIRRDSGGAGTHSGGCGVIRRIEFLQPLEVSILSERRGPYPPYGMEGGEPGALGQNTLILADGTWHDLGATAHFTAGPGDILTIETPGGGGWGKAVVARFNRLHDCADE